MRGIYRTVLIGSASAFVDAPDAAIDEEEDEA